MPIPPKTLSRVFRTAPAKAALAVGGAALATGALLAYPATASASAATNSANHLIRRSPLPSFSLPVILPSTQFPSAGNSTFIPVGVKRSAQPKQSQDQFNYVSTFSPAPITSSTPASTASAVCLANGQPVSGSGDLDLPGINGGSHDTGHAGALPINTLGPTAMLPPQIDSTNLGQLKVTRPVDATSANLAMVASSGYRFPCVHIEIGPGRGFANAEYALVNAGLVADDRSGSTEILTWTYSTILWSYTLPGSATVHQGSGEINAQPDRTSTSLVTDSKAVAAGTIGLTLVVSLGLVTLYIVGKRRNRARYRARYYRRAVARTQREAFATAGFAAIQPVTRVEPGEIWEPEAGEAPSEVGEVSESSQVSEAAETVEPVEAAEHVEIAEAVEKLEPESAPELKSAQELESAQESESEAESEPEPELADVAEADESAELAETEPVDTEPAETELAETEHEAESTESDVGEAASAEPESEPEPESDEPVAPAESATEPEPESSPESEPASEPESSSETETEPETESAEGDAHEPATAH